MTKKNMEVSSNRDQTSHFTMLLFFGSPFNLRLCGSERFRSTGCEVGSSGEWAPSAGDLAGLGSPVHEEKRSPLSQDRPRNTLTVRSGVSTYVRSMLNLWGSCLDWIEPVGGRLGDHNCGFSQYSPKTGLAWTVSRSSTAIQGETPRNISEHPRTSVQIEIEHFRGDLGRPAEVGSRRDLSATRRPALWDGKSGRGWD